MLFTQSHPVLPGQAMKAKREDTALVRLLLSLCFQVLEISLQTAVGKGNKDIFNLKKIIIIIITRVEGMGCQVKC